MDKKQIIKDENLISYCGFYCGACPKYLKEECSGFKGNQPNCAVGYRSCKVRPCCMLYSYKTCADCKQYETVKNCKDYNPLMIRFGEFVSRTNRRKAIEMIKVQGAVAYIEFMVERKWVSPIVKK